MNVFAPMSSHAMQTEMKNAIRGSMNMSVRQAMSIV